MAGDEREKDADGPESDRPMTLGQHLLELRRRVFRSLLYVMAAAILCAVFEDEVVGFVLHPYWKVLHVQPDSGFQVTEVAEAILARMWLDVVVGLFLAGPFVLLEIWGFVSRALYDRERRAVRVFAPVSMLLFLAGCAFYYFVIQPYTLEALLQYGISVPLPDGGTAQVGVHIRLDNAIRFYVTMSLVLGITFQLPLFMIFAQKIGLVSWRTYSKYRRHFFMVNLVGMAILTPTGDAITLIACMAPVIVLFEGGILVCRLMAPDIPKDEDPEETTDR